MKKRLTAPRIDGISPKDIIKLRGAIRKVWSWCYPRRLCVARALNEDGEFSTCEACKRIVAKVYPDHIIPCGDLDGGYIERMFCPSSGLQALCNACHRVKTRQERAALAKRAKKSFLDSF